MIVGKFFKKIQAEEKCRINRKIFLKYGFYAKNLPAGIDIAAGKWYNSQSNEVAHSSPCSAIRRTGQYSNGTFSLYRVCWRGLYVRAFILLKKRRCFIISTKKELEINEEIRDKEVRVIGANGEQLGVMSPDKALALAEQANLDLIKIAPNAQPPVCRILDYGKYRFEQRKKEKENRKNQKVVETKEVRLSLNIDTNDFNTKVNQANKFIKNGDKVKASIRFRGREMAHTKRGMDVMTRFGEAIEGGVIEKAAKLEGRSMQMVIAPAPKK